MSNSTLQIHVRQYSFDSPELRDSVYDDLMDAMDKFRENPSSADFLVTKVGLRKCSGLYENALTDLCRFLRSIEKFVDFT